MSPGSRFRLARFRLEWKLLERRSPGPGAPQRDVDECIAQKGFAVTFIVHASRGEDSATTIRLSAAAAIAKARALVDKGWQVFITGPDGIRYGSPDFDRLLSRSPALY
jgi:hypothetical protein